MVQPLWKTFWQFLRKLNMLSPCYSAVTLFVIYPKELKTYIYTNTCTHMFIASLFIIVKIWKQPRCSAVGAWINKLWYI